MNLPVWGWDIIAVFLLFTVGVVAVITKRNMLKVLLGLEIMSKSVMLGFVVAGKINGKLNIGQSITTMIIVIDAAIVAIILAFIVNTYIHYGRIDVKKLTRLRG